MKIFKLIALLTLFGALYSCHDDLYNNHEHNHGENKNKITLSQFKSETKIKDFKTIIKSNIQAMKSTNRVAELSDFVIDTLAIQRHVSQNNKTTYSFKIYPLSNVSQPNEIFNLVYRLENNNWEQSIFSLVKKSNPLPSEEQFENKTLLFDSKTTSTTARAGEMCISEMYYVQCDGSCHGQCDGFACPTGQCIQKTIMIDFCGGSGGATGGGGDPNNGGPTGYIQSGYIPTNPYEFTPNMFDNPVYDDPNYVNAIKAQHFFSNLSYSHQVWANENVEAYNQLIQYQIDNNWSDESEVFAEELIDELANISIDSYPGKEDLFPFEWWNDDALIEQYLQGPYESWRNISSEEKRLTKSFPTIAYKLYKNKDIAFQKTFQYFGNVPQVLNGKPDAFRHAFFQAINTVSIRKYFTELFANAHESEVPTIWSLEKEMDIYNNEIGMNLIEFTHPNWSNTNQIATEILNMLNNGELIYLKPINYSSPYFWDNPSTSTPNDGNHGISNNTQLTPTNQ